MHQARFFIGCELTECVVWETHGCYDIMCNQTSEEYVYKEALLILEQSGSASAQHPSIYAFLQGNQTVCSELILAYSY